LVSFHSQIEYAKNKYGIPYNHLPLITCQDEIDELYPKKSVLYIFMKGKYNNPGCLSGEAFQKIANINQYSP
jgi:hypothetical protein